MLYQLSHVRMCARTVSGPSARATITQPRTRRKTSAGGDRRGVIILCVMASRLSQCAWQDASMATTEDGFTAEEKAAIKQAAAERRRSKAGKNGEADVLAAIAAMDEGDRPIAEGLHALVARALPELTCKTWYGFPAYCKEGKTVFFYQFAGKFKSRYGHIAFEDTANLDDGDMWPTAFAILEWNEAVEARVAELIKRAVGPA